MKLWEETHKGTHCRLGDNRIQIINLYFCILALNSSVISLWGYCDCEFSEKHSTVFMIPAAGLRCMATEYWEIKVIIIRLITESYHDWNLMRVR